MLIDIIGKRMITTSLQNKLVKGEDILKALRKLCDEIEIAVLVVSMTASKSDYSEYKSDKYEDIIKFIVM